ncbi:MAG: hypothetical protein ACO3CI_07960 [Schleiferiaceae bacterium]
MKALLKYAVIMVVTASSVLAQSGKTSIAILDFTASSNVSRQFIQTAQEATTQ